MVSDGKRSHYITVERVSVLLQDTTSTNHQNCYYLNCVHSFRTENKCDSHENFVKITNIVKMQYEILIQKY